MSTNALVTLVAIAITDVRTIGVDTPVNVDRGIKEITATLVSVLSSRRYARDYWLPLARRHLKAKRVALPANFAVVMTGWPHQRLIVGLKIRQAHS